MNQFKTVMDCYGPLFGLKDNLQKIADGCGPDNMDLVYLAIKGCIAHVEAMMDAAQGKAAKDAPPPSE